jgi:hypothetical protein
MMNVAFFVVVLVTIGSSHGSSPPTVSKVVDFLEKLLTKSQAEGEAEDKIYAKFKCYCDDNTKEKTSEISKLTESISKLGSELEGLQAGNGELSTQCAKLKTDIADNAASQAQAKEIRSKAAKNFKEESADLEKAIGQMAEAIEILAKVGADQTKGSGSDHEKFMAGYKKSASFLGVDADVRQALASAAALLPEKQRSTVDAFLQAPFTGSYTSQSAGVMGILMTMRDTFDSNLKAAKEAEEKDVKEHDLLMTNLEALAKEMNKNYEDKQEELGENDSELAAKRLQLKSAKEGKDSSEGFLEKLEPICSKKAKEFEARKSLRANEEASIAEAVNILSSDPSLKSFIQKGDDESFFLQVGAHSQAASRHIRLEGRVQSILREAAQQYDTRLVKVVELLQASNPFSVVLSEITKMEKLIKEEQSADEEKHAFCKKETDGGKGKLKATNEEIDKIEEAIDKLDDTISKPETGLKAQEAALEKAMSENVANQKKETEMRQQENVQYQKNVAELDKAEQLLRKAIKVLKKFYSSLNEKSGVSEAAFLEKQADPKPPSTWDGAYEGQSDDAMGEKGAIGMLKYIVTATKKENTQAHKDESEAQADYEDSMATLTKQQKDQEKNLIDLKTAMTKAEQEMIDKKQDLKQANKDKKATEAYLADIKPGCDFIFDNFKLRTKNRGLEADALGKASTLLKQSPAYQAASAEAEAKALGPCKAKCKVLDHVKCKACLARVSIPGYCAGHKDTIGC